ncbi:MAG: DUF3147 family protein [Planctomycetaceae bacterium]|nr:DUF3147 family protein [Planctomycetaceae bacterium]
MWLIIKVAITSIIVVTVSEIGQRFPRWGALLLTLPIVSILAILMSWWGKQDTVAISRLARETLILVPLGLPFFVPLAFYESWGLSFWPAFFLGILLASITIGAWMLLGPKTA